ncbi:MAG: hypothetical protein JO013_16325 [Alphaproteobacteria bacterium]|nr:hypothetical protein [Alphaproteobacteria bacterium]
MRKFPFVAAAAMLVAMPALAQTSGSTIPDMSKPATSATSSATMGQTAPGQTTGATTDSGWGTTGGTGATTMSTGGATAGSWNSGSTAYTGRGGPDTGKAYPMCSRTLRDNCMQRGGRGRAMARRHGR